MVLQNYQNLMEIISNMIYIAALGVGLKCPIKIHLNTQCGGGGHPCPSGFTSPDIQESYFSLGTENIFKKQKWEKKFQKLWYFPPIYPPDPLALIFEKSYFNLGMLRKYF